MKTSIYHHIEAIKTTWNELSKGNFLVYFIPGVIITFLFISVNLITNTLFGGNEITESANWFSSIFSKVGSIIDFMLTQLYIFIILTLLSPFNTILSEKLDTKITGQKFSFSFLRLINDFLRMILIVIISLIIQFVCIGIWWIIAWILNIDNTFLYDCIAFLISAFFFGFSFYDHSLERYEINVFGSIGFAFSNVFLIIVTGSLFKLFYYFPYFWNVSYIGIMIAPVVTTMISTVVYLRLINKNSNQKIQTDI
jgi:CysZ protein